MAESHRSGRRSPGHDERLRGGFREFYGIDGKRSGILVGERRVHSGLECDFSHGAFERDADVRSGIHGPDGLGHGARHHEAARTFGLGRYLGESSVIVPGRLLYEGRKGRPSLSRRGVVVGYGVERALGAGRGLGKCEGRRLCDQLVEG